MLGHANHRGLGGHVYRPAAALLTSDRCNVHDTCPRLHAPGCRAHAAHGALLVGLDNAVKVLVRKAIDRLKATFENARVINEDINLAKLLLGGSHHALGVFGLGNIGRNDKGLAAGSLNLGRNLFERSLATRSHDNLCALGSKQLGNSSTYTGVRTGDDSNLVIQTAHNSSSLCGGARGPSRRRSQQASA